MVLEALGPRFVSVNPSSDPENGSRSTFPARRDLPNGPNLEANVHKLTFVHPDGSSQTVEADDGQSVMRAALNGMVRGIVGECGGELSCATCHVFVDGAWMSKTGEVSEDEQDLLDTTSEEPTDCSRLSCQIKMNPSLEGLIVQIPASQR